MVARKADFWRLASSAFSGLLRGAERFLDRVGHAVEGVASSPISSVGARIEAALQVAALKGMDAIDHSGDAAGQQVGHPDRDADDHDDHQQGRAPQAEGGRRSGFSATSSSSSLRWALKLMSFSSTSRC
jgi:hypothetical protein